MQYVTKHFIGFFRCWYTLSVVIRFLEFFAEYKQHLTNKAHYTFLFALSIVYQVRTKALETDFHLMAHAGTRSNKEFNGMQPLLCEQLQNSLLTVASRNVATRIKESYFSK